MKKREKKLMGKSEKATKGADGSVSFTKQDDSDKNKRQKKDFKKKDSKGGLKPTMRKGNFEVVK